MDNRKENPVFNKDNLTVFLLSLVVLLSALAFFFHDNMSFQSESLPADNFLPQIVAGDRYTQEFLCTHDGLSKIRLFTASFARSNSGTAFFTLNDMSGNAIQTWNIPAAAFPDNSYLDLVLDDPIVHSSGQRYLLSVASDSPEGGAPTIYTTVYGGSSGLSSDEGALNCSLCFQLEYKLPASSFINLKTVLITLLLVIIIPLSFKATTFFFPVSKLWLLAFPLLIAVFGCHRFLRHTSPAFFPVSFLAVAFVLFCLLWIAGSVFLYRLVYIKKCPVEKLAVILLSVFSIFTIGMITPGAGNDEQFHYAFAYKYANIYSFKGFSDPVDESGDHLVYMRPEDRDLLSGMINVPIYITEGSYRNVIKESSFFSSDNSLYTYKISDVLDSASFNSNNVPLGYIVSGLGVAIARLLHLGAIPTFYMGRLFNAAFFIFLVYLSIKIIPVGKESLLIFSLFPMMLQQTVTYSYDSFILGIVFLFTAFTVSVFRQDTKVTLKQFIILACLSVALALSKFVYAPLILILIAVPSDRFNLKNARKIKAGIIGAIAVAGFIAMIWLQNTRGIFNYFTPSFASADQSFFVIAVKYFEMLQMSVIKISDFYIHSLVAYPGWYQFYIPETIVSVYYLLLLLSMIRTEGEEKKTGTALRVWGAFLMIVTFVLITLPMASKFTNVGSETIDNVQGRYFLPLVPLIVTALRTRHIKADPSFGLKIIWGAEYLSFLFFGYMFLTVFQAI